MIPFLDLASDYAEVASAARARIDGVLARQLFVLGPETAELEDSLRARTGAGAAIACSSGSDALHLALLALGIGAGDAVIVPAFTFFASAGEVARTGAQPVFCDIDEDTFLAGHEQVGAVIERSFDSSLRHRGTGARLRAVLVVHMYGRLAPMPELLALARRHDLRIVEDAAQAIDARLAGRAAGCFGDVGCLSFYPTKNLGGAGDGGMLLTSDASLAARLARLRVHGAAPGSYEHEEIGINARMSELEAAVLNAKLERLTAWTQRRRHVAALYLAGLKDAHDRGDVVLPPPAPQDAHVWHQFALRIPRRRDEVAAALEARGTGVRVFYPLPLHLQPCFSHLGYGRGDLPVSERASQTVLCLPMHAALGDDSVARVCEQVTAACAAR